jgi:hypothetical protein
VIANSRVITPGFQLDVEGDTNIEGNLVVSGTISGGGGGSISNFTTEFFHPGAFNLTSIVNIGWGAGTVFIPVSEYNELMPGNTGYDSFINYAAIRINGSYVVQTNPKTINLKIFIYNTTKSPLFTGPINQGSLPNSSEWKTLLDLDLIFPVAGTQYYMVASENLVSQPKVSTLDVSWEATDKYLCTCQLLQSNNGNLSIPDISIDIDWTSSP